jgi:hypothetical protein
MKKLVFLAAVAMTPGTVSAHTSPFPHVHAYGGGNMPLIAWILAIVAGIAGAALLIRRWSGRPKP